jgi:hypothetical protein
VGVYYVKVYRRRRDGSYTANVVEHPHKKGKALKVAKINIEK